VEADFRHAVEPLLDQFCEQTGLPPLEHAEYTLATGRPDAVFDRLVIEYKKPGALKKTPNRPTQESIEKVKGYIEGLAKKKKQKTQRLAAVVFDGCLLIFVRFVNGQWAVEAPVEVNQHSLERFLTWLAGLSAGVALTAEQLSQDFAIEQPRTQRALAALTRAVEHATENPDNIVTKLFEQWRLFFSESIDYSEALGGRKLQPLRKWVAKAGIEVDTPEQAERFFFALHTYFALLVKFLAWLALSRHLGVKLGAPSFAGLFSEDTHTLRSRLAAMESGGIFRTYGIINLLEGDFFSWYLYAWDAQIEEAARELLKRLDEYDPATLTIVPEETRDLFKKLYHYLLPREIRHNLGEYYTPDWLAQHVLTQVDRQYFLGDPHKAEKRLRNKLLNTRWLDPACGSGTFLVLIIARMVRLADALMVPEEELLRAILRNVVGFDLNPLAVLTARVNYLLQISDLLEHRKGDVVIPVYLADSVRTPALGDRVLTVGAYEFPTAVGQLLVPSPLCVPGRFDRFCDLLEESVRAELATDAFVQRVEAAFSLLAPEWHQQAIGRLRVLYEHLLTLHKSGMDGLWARLLKNNFAPLTVGEFDYIVGNPPWVNWENLPNGYRKALKPLWEDYGLFPHGGMDTILGKGKKDISMLMAYTVSDVLLREGGRLGFVITQSVFKTSGAGQGFRNFAIPAEQGPPVHLRVLSVDDMVDLQPFEGASNRTAAFVWHKGKPTEYPLPYLLWRRSKGARFTYDSTLSEVTAAANRLHFAAQPVNREDASSAWLTARRKALPAISKVLGPSDYEAHAGAYTGGANAVYWVEILQQRPDGLVVVRNITAGAKSEVQEVTEAIEPDLLYPLLRGRDVQRWRGTPSALLIMVQDPVKRRGVDEKQLQTSCPRTYAYLKRFEKVLRMRAAFKRYFTRPRPNRPPLETGPFYSMFNVGDYTFAPWKVVWREQASSMTAAVIGPGNGKATVPDHKLMLVHCAAEAEAHYVCAALNSAIVRAAVLAYAVEIQMDPHILQNVGVPGFDAKNSTHRRLAELSAEAHEAAGSDDSKRLAEIEGEIDRQAAQLWGLTPKELAEIHKSLKELGV
jgi:hypothetical protein